MDKRGFTLIELLVVIAIIGLISTIVLTNLSAAREKARVAKAQAEISEIYRALVQYHIDHNAWPAGFFSGDINELSEWNATWSTGYIENAGIDPWGNTYYLDGMPDVECATGQAAICSAGGNEAFQSFNSPTGQAVGDDICVFFEPEC